jgi:hypothetical protein
MMRQTEAPELSPMHAVFQVRIRKPVDFVCAVLRHFHRECFLALTGDLSRYDPALIAEASAEPTPLLSPSTLCPKQQFVILPVTDATVDTICRRVLPQVGLKHRVIHVQVASEGRLVLGAYDNFHHEGVWIDQAIGDDRMALMLASGIIGWYQTRQFDPPTT